MLSSVPQAVDALGPFTALVLGLVALLFLIGTPVLFVLAIRFLWYRHVYVGRSAELEKLIWQLHRIASALEAKQVSPGKEDSAPVATGSRPIPMSMFGR
jgi:hypothetical protein